MTIQKSFLKLSILGLSALSFLHCGGSSDDPSLTLTTAQSNAVLFQIASTMGIIVEDSIGDTGGLSVANYITQDITSSNGCDEGGSATATGTQAGVDDGAIDGATDVTITFNDCEVLFSETQSVTINGTLTATGTVSLTGSDAGITGDSSVDYSGTLELSGDGIEVAGECDADLNVTADAAGQTIELTASGTICGATESYTETVTLND